MPTQYPTEFKQRAIRLINTRLQNHNAPTTRANKDTATKLGIPANTLARWCNNAALATGKEITTSSQATAEIRGLKRENAQLPRVNETLKTASAFLQQNSTAPPPNDCFHRPEQSSLWG